MAASRVTKAFLITVVLSSSSVLAKRVKVAKHASKRGSKVQLTTSKTPDLDFPGCAAWTRCSGEGCDRHYVWLDTRRQSCRYTDEYKLQEAQIAKFLPVEMARLEEKTGKFAKNGCLAGGWMWKCYRRMQQILRLFNYARKAKALVVAQGASHPAYGDVMNPETTARFTRIAENLGTGFSKNDKTKNLCIHSGIKRMLSIPGEIAKMQADAASASDELSVEEVSTIEQAKQTAALLAMTCTEVSMDQEAHIRATIEASGNAEATEPSAQPDLVDTMVSDQEELMNMLDDDGKSALTKELNEEDIDDDEEVSADSLSEIGELRSEVQDASNNDATKELMEEIGDIGEIAPFDAGNSSLVQMSTRAGVGPYIDGKRVGPLQYLVKKGWQGMKWLARNGVGWLIQRLAWTLAFMVGFAFSMVRAVAIWPMLFIGCTMYRTISWIVKDMLWNGRDVKKGFMKIGTCAPNMWDLVGFDTEHVTHSAVSQIVIQPAAFASWFSGAYHPWRSGKPKPPNPCGRVTCGLNAQCQNEFTGGWKAKCYCYTGLVAVSNPQAVSVSNPQGQDRPVNCDLKQTVSGCHCKQTSVTGRNELLHYGCSRKGQCQVDTTVPSYQTCKATLSANKKARSAQEGLGYKLFKVAVAVTVGENKTALDACQFRGTPQEVLPRSIDKTIDDYGKPVPSPAVPVPSAK